MRRDMENQMSVTQRDGEVLHVAIDREEWSEFVKAHQQNRTDIEGVRREVASLRGALRVAAWIAGVAVTVFLGVSTIAFNQFQADRREFLRQATSDREFMVGIAKDLALTNQAFSTFTSAGPRFTQDMNKSSEEALELRVKDWVRTTYPGGEQLRSTVADHEKRIQDLEKTQHDASQ